MNRRRTFSSFLILGYLLILSGRANATTTPTPTARETASASTTPSLAPSPTQTRELSAEEREFRENEAYIEALLTEINRLRAEYDRPELIPDAALEKVAAAQVSVFARLNRLSERSKDNRSLKSVAQEYQYAGGAAFSLHQNSAMVWRTTPPEYIIEKIWFSTVGERAKLLSADYLHAGIATIVINNRRFVALITGKLADGSLTYTPLPTIENATPPPADAPWSETELPDENPVVTSTPASDGSVAHVVLKDQTLSEIAAAYDIGWNGLALLNSLDPENPVIYEGDTILIQPRFTDTVTPTITKTPIPPTRTPRPTYTADPTNAAANPASEEDREPGGYINDFFMKIEAFKPALAWGLIGLSVLGLIMTLLLRKPA